MRILVLANTPAHVHTYRHVVDRLEDRGHDVLVLARDYACTRDLLEYFEMPHEIYGAHDTGDYSPVDFAAELGGQLFGIAAGAGRFRPDVVFGRGPYAAAAGTLTRSPVVLVLDDEPADFNHAVSRPFADAILSPASTRRDLGPDHYAFDGFKECAYLHPEVYEPVADVREYLAVDEDEPYVLLRFNALDALHDVGVTGFTRDQRERMIERLAREATVFVSDEGGEMDLRDLPARPYDLHPALIHDAMREAELLVADTGTMVTEAGLLGTPAIRYGGSEDHEFGEFAALEDAGLIEDLTAYEAAEERALEIVTDDEIGDRRRRRRDEYVGDLVNLTDLLVDVAEMQGGLEQVARRSPGVAPKSLLPSN